MDAYVIPFCAGAFMKIVDEIEDVNLLNLKEYIPYFYSLCTLFITLWLYNDIYSSIFCIICLIPACFFVNEIDTVFWKTLIPIPFITFLFKMNTLEWLGVNDLIQRIVFILAWVIGIYLETKVTPEETSDRKIFMRLGIILLLLIPIYFTNDFSSVVFIKTICVSVIGYCAVSVISKSLLSDPISPKPKIDELDTH